MMKKLKTEKVEKLVASTKEFLFSVADRAALANGHPLSSEVTVEYYKSRAKAIKMAAIDLRIRKSNAFISLRKE